jgi:hypothetical protein
MKPTPEQIRVAMANHRRLPRTRDALIRDALIHAKQSKQRNADAPK